MLLDFSSSVFLLQFLISTHLYFAIKPTILSVLAGIRELLDLGAYLSLYLAASPSLYLSLYLSLRPALYLS